jgi:hypothetical protein
VPSASSCAGCSPCWSPPRRCGSRADAGPARTAPSTPPAPSAARCTTAARSPGCCTGGPGPARAGSSCSSTSPARPAATEVFTIGTRLDRVTRELRLRDPDKALAASGSAIPDWSGGTRLGEVLKAFLDRWGQRGTARGAVVVVCSDGWERGGTEVLAEQMARLRRLAHAVVWVNPHKGREGYEPLTGGMQAALPSVDHFVAGHSLAAFQQLTGVISRA